MKKFLKVLVLILVLFFAILLAIPYFFKDALVEKIKEEANKQINATLTFDEVELTFFSHFPKLTLELTDFKISGIDSFEGVDLVAIQKLGLSVELGSLLSGDIPSISELYVDGATVNAIVHPSGVANWDIAKASKVEAEEKEAEEQASDETIRLEIDYYRISDSYILYKDESSNIHLKVDNLNHSGSGNFGLTDFTLLTETQIDNVLLEYENETYLDNWKMDAKINIDINMDDYLFVLSDNEFHINELLLKSDGSVQMKDTSIYLDLSVAAPQLDLRQLISLTPPSYSSDLEGYTFGGKSALSAWVKGEYSDNTYPLFALDMNVNNGSFHYSELPKSVDDIEITMHVESPSATNLDKLWIDLSKFTMNMGGNPISLGFSLHQPMSSMDFNSKLSASIDFESLKDVFPPETYSIYKGSVQANLQAEGSLSEIEKENYDNLNASGRLQATNIDYSNTVSIPKALLTFKMDKVELEGLDAKIGRSDISASGSLENFIPYALYDKELTGELNLQSNLLDINEMTTLMTEDSTETVEQVSANDSLLTDNSQVNGAAEDTLSEILPKNIHFKLKAGVNELVYDDIVLTSFKGDLELEEGVLTLSSCSAKALGGDLNLSGSVDETISGKPIASFTFKVKDMVIQESAERVELLNRYFPIAKYAKGSYSGSVKLDSRFDKEWNPIYESVYSKGSVKTKSVKIEGFKLMDDFAAITKTESILDNEFEDMDIAFEIIDGKGYIKPFDFQLDQAKGKAFGSIDLEQNLNFDVNMNVPTEMLGEGANQLMGQIAGALSGFGVETEVPEKIEMDIKITGTVEKPKILPNFSGVGGETVKEVVKQKIEEEIDKAKEEAMAKASEEAEKILADARKEADKLLKDAKKQVDLLKKEGYAQADKLVADANGFFEKTAAEITSKEMKKQVDKQADNLMMEAKKQADKILEDAQKQADRLKN